MSNGTRYNPDEWNVVHTLPTVRLVVHVTTGEKQMIDHEGYFVEDTGPLIIDAGDPDDDGIQIPTSVTRHPPKRI